MDALIEERIESFKNELSRIVHAAVEDALEGYRQTLLPLSREPRVDPAARAIPRPGPLGGEGPDSVEVDRPELFLPQQQALPLPPGPELELAAGRQGTKPLVDPFWSQAAAAISSPAEVRPAGLRTSAARRSPRELEAVGHQVLECLREGGGETVLGLARALGQPTSELRRPVQLLLAAGAIQKRSSTQGERFFAA